MTYRLGIDIGTSSVALAAFSLDGTNTPRDLIYLDEYIFGEPVSPGYFVLNNAIRRQKRAMRRNWDRKKARIQKLLHLARLCGVELSAIQSAGKAMRHTTDVWRLRAEALDRCLPLPDLFLVLLRMAKNRGYAGVTPESSKSTVGNAIRQASVLMASTGARTIGEALWKHATSQTPPVANARFRKLFSSGKGAAVIRGTYVLRSDVKDEFDLIIREQEKHHPILSSSLATAFGDAGASLLREGSHFFPGSQPETLSAALREAIFYQRPLPPFTGTIGACELVPAERRLSTAHPAFQRFRIAKLIADLRWKRGRAEAPLTPDQRRVIRMLLLENGEIEFGEIYDSLRDHDCMPSDGRLNLHTSRTTHLKGDQTSAAWRDLRRLGEWNDLGDANQGKVIDILADEIGDPQRWQIQEVRDGIRGKYGDAVADFLAKLADDDGALGRLSKFGLPSGRAAYGVTACARLADLLESEDVDEASAIRKAFPDHAQAREIVPTGKLPAVDQLNLRSPVVLRALRESHKAISACVRRLGGPPSAVVVELMADMRRTLEQRREVSLRQRLEEKTNRDARKDLLDNGYAAKPGNIRRWVLWKEQSRLCPYSGQTLSLRDALDGSRTHYEHILPRSLHGVGSRKSDLVLCLNEFNQMKGDETPWAAAEANADKWDWNATKGAVKAILKGNRGFRRKAAMILNRISAADAQEDLEGFVERQYSDTAWIGREVHDWCRHLCSDVTVVRGALTGSLRHQWGLDTALEEVRIREGRHGPGLLDLPEDERLSRATPRAAALFYRELPAGDRRFEKRCDHRHHLLDAIVVALSTRSLYQQEVRRRANRARGEDRGANAVGPYSCPIPELRKLVVDRLTGYVVWQKPDRLIGGRMFDEMPFGLLPDNRLLKGGMPAKKSFNPKYDRVIKHRDRRGNQHTKAVVKAAYACMRVTDDAWDLLTVEQFLSAGYLQKQTLKVPDGERLIFKSDLVYHPGRQKFFRVSQFAEDSGLLCVDTVETSTFEDLKGTGLNIKIGRLVDIKSLRTFGTKPDLARFLAEIRRGESANAP